MLGRSASVLYKIDESPGKDVLPEDRSAKLASAKELNIALCGLTIVAAIAFGLGCVRFHLLAVVLALLPGALIYLIHRKPLLYTIFNDKRDPRPDLGTAFMICGLGLFAGTFDVYFVETSTLLFYAVLVSLLCTVAFFSSVRQSSGFFAGAFGVLVIACFYGWGLAATTDTLLDKSPPARYTTTVWATHESHGREFLLSDACALGPAPTMERREGLAHGVRRRFHWRTCVP
jgi:hypothetical protein